MAEAQPASPQGTNATSPPAESLQDVILALQRFWAAEGCLLLPACDFAVPFAALHPDAFFGVLGRQPWRAAFLQPVRRPLAGRYGEHPYRLGKHLQFQVVFKPPPADVQALYLGSLEALGLELALHDVRFSEWSWQPRSVGGSGSGWHALLDGLGVSRLTFLERLADRDLDPVCVENCYGLERLAMTLQGVASVSQVRWSQQGTDYGRLRQREEEELSRYAFEVADPGEVLRRLEVLEHEAERCLKEGLARSAYELSVRCLEPIDLLEARGVLSARERVGWLERVRGRVVAVAGAAIDRVAGDQVVGDQVAAAGAAIDQVADDRVADDPPVLEPAATAKKKRPAKSPKRRKRGSRSRAKPGADGSSGGADSR